MPHNSVWELSGKVLASINALRPSIGGACLPSASCCRIAQQVPACAASPRSLRYPAATHYAAAPASWPPAHALFSGHACISFGVPANLVDNAV